MDQLKRNQGRALKALLENATVVGAAEAAGVSPTSIYRYLADPDFRSALAARQGELMGGVVASLAGAAGEAVDVLRSTATNPKAADGVRVRAAGLLLENLLKVWQFSELEQRIAQLEKRLA